MVPRPISLQGEESLCLRHNSGKHFKIQLRSSQQLPAEYPCLTRIRTLLCASKDPPTLSLFLMPLQEPAVRVLWWAAHGFHLIARLMPGESLLPQRCLKSPPCTYPNTTGNDEWMYSGENIWPVTDGCRQVDSLLSPPWWDCTIMHFRQFSEGQSCKIKQLIGRSSSW